MKYLTQYKVISEWVLLLFILSGLIKSLIVPWATLSIDINFLLFFFLICLTSIKIYSGKVKFTEAYILGLALAMAFYAVVIFSMFYTKSLNYFTTKGFVLLINILVFLFAYILHINAKIFIKKFNIVVIASAIIYLFSLTLLVNGAINLSPEKTLAFSGIGLSIGEYLGLAIIAIAYLKPYSNKMNYLLMISSAFLLLLTGARGPVFAIIIVLFFLYFIRFVKSLALILVDRSGQISKSSLYRWSLVVSLFGLFVYLVIQNINEIELLEKSVSRFQLLLSSDKGNSINARLSYFETSLTSIENSPLLGNGIGSFGILTLGVDGRAYPHNIFLEIWFELGLLGLLVFLISIIFSLTYSTKSKNYFVGMALFYLMLNYMKSSSITDIRLFYYFLAVAFLPLIENKVRLLK